MQTSKFLFSMGALASVILALPVQGAPDTPEQAKMREVLRRMMEQTAPAEGAPAAAVAAPAATPAPAKPVAAPPPAKPVPAQAKPVAAPAKPASNQLPPPSQPSAAPVVPVAPPPPVAPAAVPATAPQAFEAVPPADNAASLARAREVMRQKLLELQTSPAPQTSVAAVAPAPSTAPLPVVPAAVTPPPSRPAPVAATSAATAYKPIEAPSSPLPASKQARLADLLVRYKADTITAQEYHTQRAAIIAEP